MNLLTGTGPFSTHVGGGRRQRPTTATWFVALVLGFVAVTGAVTAANGYDEPFDPVAGDVTVRIQNATTGQPGDAERVTVELLGSVRKPVGEARRVTGQIELSSLTIIPARDYLVTVLSGGVNYYTKVQGSELTADPLTVHVFDVTSTTAAVAIDGMNLIVRRQGSTLALEYFLTVVNEARPQVAVVPAPATVEFALPRGASGIAAEELRGPEPRPLAVVSGADGRVGVAAALTPGPNRLRITARVSMDTPTTLPVEFQLPVRNWSLLVFPAEMYVYGRGLERESVRQNDDLTRYVGPTLAAGQEMLIEIGRAAEPQVATEVFTRTAPAEAGAAAATATADAGGFKLPVGIAAGVAILAAALLVWLRKRA